VSAWLGISLATLRTILSIVAAIGERGRDHDGVDAYKWP
jgi:hypothetical protein